MHILSNLRPLGKKIESRSRRVLPARRSQLVSHQTLPDELTCTSMKQRWSVPRGKKLQQQEIQNVLVKRPQLGATYSRFIKSNLYSPSSMYLTLTKEHFANCQPQPLFATVLPSESQLPNIPFVQSKFGN